MPILFAVVARSTIVLAKHASCSGNFAEVSEQVLAKVPPGGGKLTYTHGQYMFHYIASSEDGVVYMCITDGNFDRVRAFAFLVEIRRRFTLTYGQRIQTALPYAMNSDFSLVLAGEMKVYNNMDREPLKLTNAQSQVEDLKKIMVRNIDSLTDRGERLELLISRSQDLESNSVAFRTSSKTLARQMFVKNMKITIILLVVLAVVIFIVVTASCGGLSYSKCR